MRLFDTMAEKIRENLRSFLKIQPASVSMLNIIEQLDYYGSAARNRIWARGDAEELIQLYKMLPGAVNGIRFWAAVPTEGNDINKLHTGIPKLVAQVLTDIVIGDMNEIVVTPDKYQSIWESILEDNDFEKLLEKAIHEVLIVGDGAFKISFDPALTEWPIIEFYPGDNVEYVYKRGRLTEIKFKTNYQHKHGLHTLVETYGKGYIRSALFRDNNEIDLHAIPETANIPPAVTFDGDFMMAEKFQVSDSVKYEGRGASIFDSKTDSADSLDESWSQWMDALRHGRSKEYIPENMIPRSPSTGEILKPNPFDNAYIKCDSSVTEGQASKITTEQPTIPHESYLATYCTALDLFLQGIISPSTLGIDVKKLDNAEAQREKEKTTLYSRNKIVSAVQETIPKLINKVFKAYSTWKKQAIEDVKTEVPFGEYANPSFESQVETVGKGKTSGVMSIEACVDELYGDSKEDEWKAEEVARLKAEQGIANVEEPQVNQEVDGFKIGFEG